MQETPQDRTKVRMYTDQFIIVGDIAMFSGTRLTDYISSAHVFIAVTDAVVRTLDGKALFSSEFLDVHKEKVVMIVPEAMVKPA